MEIKDILDLFAKKTEYDRKQTRFNLLSVNWEYHEICKNVDYLIDNGYDKNGYISVLYLKKAYHNLLKQMKISLYDLFLETEDISDEKMLFDAFLSEPVLQAEMAVTDMIRQAEQRMAGDLRIGDSDICADDVLGSLEHVIRELKKLKTDVLIPGTGPIGAVTKFGTKIHVFETYGECALKMESAPDGMYLCYIDACRSADGFFTFMIKSGGSLISVHDRIDEQYAGQHARLNERNGRWAEAKVDIFPYDYIFQYRDFDGKGCAHTYEIQEELCSMSAMSEKAYMPLILAMYLVAQKVEDYIPEAEKRVYISSLLKESRLLLKGSGHALIPASESSLVQNHDTLSLGFSMSEFLDGTFAMEFAPPEHWNGGDPERIYTRYDKGNDRLINLYGADFTPDLSSLFTGTAVCLLSDDECHEYIPEYVGTRQSFRNQMYYEARRQLAQHIKEKMEADYLAFGGRKGVSDWFQNIMEQRMDAFGPVCCAMEARKDETSRCIADHVEEFSYRLTRSALKGGIDKEKQWGSVCVNGLKNGERCRITGTRANYWFWAAPTNAKGISMLTGIPVTELPAFLQVWELNDRYGGNPLLDRVDPLSLLESPHKKDRCMRFYVSAGFSRSGWKKLKKEKEYDKQVTAEMLNAFG